MLELKQDKKSCQFCKKCLVALKSSVYFKILIFEDSNFYELTNWLHLKTSKKIHLLQL